MRTLPTPKGAHVCTVAVAVFCPLPLEFLNGFVVHITPRCRVLQRDAYCPTICVFQRKDKVFILKNLKCVHQVSVAGDPG